MKIFRTGLGQSLLTFITLLVYRQLFGLYSSMVGYYSEDGNIFAIMFGAILLLAIFAIPLVALLVLCRCDLSGAGFVRQRLLLHILVMTPAIYTLTFLMCLLTNGLSLMSWAWVLVAGILLLLSLCIRPAASDKPYSPILRVSHGLAALVFVGGFLAMHLASHLGAIWSSELHAQTLDVLRPWYRSKIVEPVLLGACGFLVISGFYMAQIHIRRGANAHRMLQTVTGFYLGVFIITHVSAVLSARKGGVDTNWFFATGENGLLLGPSILIPYYALSILFAFIHLALGIRQVLGAHGVKRVTVEFSYALLSRLGLGLTVIIMIAAMGFSFS
jgi:hypothetical protein